MILVAALAVLAAFLWQRAYGFMIRDEGFLWYGVQRVMAGEVPIRDFDAYDPGRYYWSAALMSLWGDDGILSLRIAVAAFQFVGLAVGLWLATREGRRRDPVFWALAALTLLTWMLPRHKLFDITLAIVLVGGLAFLVDKPVVARYFAAGGVVGLVAVFGRNHGVYGVAGSLIAMAFLATGRREVPVAKGFAAWAAGVAVGYLPVALLVVLVPGFFDKFVEGIRFLFEVEATNLPLPVPWPWTASGLYGAMVGVFFVALFLFPLVAIAGCFFRRFKGREVSPLLAASAFMALPYAHYAYSRADIGHLAQSVFPALLGLLALAARRPPVQAWGLALVLCAASVYVTLPQHGGYRCRVSGQCTQVLVGKDALVIDPVPTAALAAMKQVVERHVPPGRTFYVAPFWPGAYAALGFRSPAWEIYPLFPRSAAFEAAEIARLRAADPVLAVIVDEPLDGREELRFRNTHPAIDKYVRENFERVAEPGLAPSIQVYRKR